LDDDDNEVSVPSENKMDNEEDDTTERELDDAANDEANIRSF